MSDTGRLEIYWTIISLVFNIATNPFWLWLRYIREHR
jgi:hypothetical protein